MKLDFWYTALPWELPADWPAFLQDCKQIGFSGISIPVRLMDCGNMEPHYQRAVAVREADMDVLLRVVASTEHAEWVPVVCRLKDDGFNIHTSDSKPIMRKLCGEVKTSGLLALATQVSIGWSSSWECDAMAWSTPWWWLRTPAQSQAYRDAVRTMIGTAVSVLGTGVPIGGQRGSLWHVQEQRLTLPPYYRESACYLADAWVPTQEKLLTSCDLARQFFPGDYVVNEWDYDGYLAGHPNREWASEMLARFRILAEHGIHGQIIHMHPDEVRANAEVLVKAGEIFANA